MSRNARIEEVSDSDSDPEITDISTIAPPSSRPSQNNTLLNPSQIPGARPSANQPPAFDPATAKEWVCLYPIYFDANKSRQEGRRVGKELAVQNPLAKAIADAAASLGLRCFFEPSKCHPKDWGNVGRVKVELKGSKGVKVNNKHHLYILISTYLKSHPTKPTDPLSLPIRGLPMPKETPGPPACPRGWKLNDILPLHSPAISGGGVSEDFLKDMMAEMGNQAGAGGAANPQMQQMQQLANMMGSMGGAPGGAGEGSSGGGGGEPKIKKPKKIVVRR